MVIVVAAGAANTNAGADISKLFNLFMILTIRNVFKNSFVITSSLENLGRIIVALVTFFSTLFVG